MRYGVWAPIPQYASGVRKWMPGRNGRRLTAVVIHRMDGTLDGSDSWLRSPYSASASTHFGVGAMGWLNRSLRRWQIRQWVDTNDTAYGWGARPTDVPTPLAVRTLAPDLWDPRADLNWQVIAIEVEGFWYQPWAPGIASKVRELLNAIGRAHGPLIVMAHTDCSVKPCPGMATFQAALPGMYGNRLLLPDTSTPVGYDVNLNDVTIPGDTGRLFTVRAGTTLYANASHSKVHFKTSTAMTYQMIGFHSNGDVFASNPKNPGSHPFLVPPSH